MHCVAMLGRTWEERAPGAEASGRGLCMVARQEAWPPLDPGPQPLMTGSLCYHHPQWC